MKVSVIDIARDLIRINTTEGTIGTYRAIGYVKELLDKWDIPFQLVSMDSWHAPNLFSEIKGKDPSLPTLLLYGHIDTVGANADAWITNPYGGNVLFDQLYGRGALDMKGPLAAMIAAYLEAAVEQPEAGVALLIVQGEETSDSNGMEHVVYKHPDLFKNIRHAIGEFGGFSLMVHGKKFFLIGVQEKTYINLTLIHKGEARHPAIGDYLFTGTVGDLLRKIATIQLPLHYSSVTAEMLNIMALELEITTDELVGCEGEPFLRKLLDGMQRNTLTVESFVMEGTEGLMPSQAVIQLIGSICPGSSASEMLHEMRREFGNVEITSDTESPAAREVDYSQVHLLVDALQKHEQNARAVPYMFPGTTDAGILAQLGVQTYGFTPIDLPPHCKALEMIHAPDERVPVKSLVECAKILHEVILRYRG